MPSVPLQTRLAKVWPVVLWLLNAAGVWLTGGLESPLFAVFTPLIIACGWVVSGAAGILFAVLSSLLGLVMMFIELAQPASQAADTAVLAGYWLAGSFVFIASSLAIYTIQGRMKGLAEQNSRSQQANLAAQQEAERVQSEMQNQLDSQAAALEQRSAYLQATFEVGRAASTMLDPASLVRESVELIRQQFDLYYVALFLLDPGGEWAILQAGTGAAGEAMLRRKHRIRVGSGMIGWCIANSQARVALDIRQDDVRLANPELPETASEAAFPLRSRGRLLGALGVQSRHPQAFGRMETSAFQSLADQLAIALDNASLLQETQRTLENLQARSKEASRKAWQELIVDASARQGSPGGLEFGYRFAGRQLSPASGEWTPGMRQAIASGESVIDAAARLSIPVRSRGETIGVLMFERPEESDRPPGSEISPLASQPKGWEREQVRVLEGLAEQLGAAMESARLYQEAQRLALREQMTTEVTSRLRESLDIDTILRTAVQEIARTLGDAEVLVTLGTPPNNGVAGQSETPLAGYSQAVPSRQERTQEKQ